MTTDAVFLRYVLTLKGDAACQAIHALSDDRLLGVGALALVRGVRARRSDRRSRLFQVAGECVAVAQQERDINDAPRQVLLRSTSL